MTASISTILWLEMQLRLIVYTTVGAEGLYTGERERGGRGGGGWKRRGDAAWWRGVAQQRHRGDVEEVGQVGIAVAAGHIARGGGHRRGLRGASWLKELFLLTGIVAAAAANHGAKRAGGL
jgi:hypothetical protein